MDILERILNSQHLQNKPLVLVDVGASGEVNPIWNRIAPFSHCVCFDADDRDFVVTDEENKGFKKLIKINRAVAENAGSVSFYYTKSPYCSGTLPPDNEALKPWVFASYFDVVKTEQLQKTTIGEALKAAGISYIDWLKLDTQGTDLRLYTSLPKDMRENLVALEMEPGIIDAYKGEDKLHSVLATVAADNFWLCSMTVKGSRRIDEKYLEKFGEGNIRRAIPEAPGWAELRYLKNIAERDTRQLLLLYVFAVVQQQYGFALEVCEALTQTELDFSIEEAKRYVVNCIQTHDLKAVTLKTRVQNYLLRKLQPQ